MDAVTVTLIVAGVAAGAALVQATVQGVFTTRAASVAARQETARARIALLDRLAKRVADAGQAANVYALELSEEFLENWSARGPLLHNVMTPHGRALADLEALPADCAAREPVRRALEVTVALPSVGKPRELNAAWSRDRHAIREALEALGRERAHELRMLEAAAYWWPKSRRRVAGERPAGGGGAER